MLEVTLRVVLLLLCLLIMWMGVIGVRTGRVRGKGWSGLEILTGRLIYRDERPVLFWLTVLAYLACPPIIVVSLILDGM